MTHDDSAGGNGDVGVEGRHDLGLWRGERGVVEAGNEVMMEAVESIQPVYDSVQKAYEENNLMDLP